ncbi:inositol monophosphatase [Candidatus Gottesmanbacteria bacterium]|nr:inositol monophosphatase [Candidatus Gottesmanbacteria bacterium]
MIDFLVAITREAGERVLRESRRIRGKKAGSGNWVTEADLVSESYLTSAIHQAYSLHKILTDPGYKVLTEETNTDIVDPTREDHLWVIDPLDGTTNFAYQLPLCAVSVAYLERGEVLYGAVYDPFRHELFWAERGKGAFLNGDRIQVHHATTFNGALVDIGSPYLSKNFRRTCPVGIRLHNEGARIVNLGTAALECAYVACGGLSLYYEVGLKPWDVAAGALLIKEAGGTVVSEGDTFNLFHFERFLAGNPTLVKKAQTLIP